jgi:hypothetical protein
MTATSGLGSGFERRHIRGRVGPFYNAEEFPYVAIPLVAWLGSSRFTMSEGRARVRRTVKSLLGRLGPTPVDAPQGSAVAEHSER